AHDRRRRERPPPPGTRPERPHPGGKGVHLRHPSRAPSPGPEARRVHGRRAPPGARGEALTAIEQPRRMGFFTDTSVCIGCKACEVACKEWNLIPEDGLSLTGMSYDNSVGLSADT